MKPLLQNFNADLKKILFLFLLTISVNASLSGQTASITVTSPNGGEVWLQGATSTITWEYTGGPATGLIEYSEDGGQWWYVLDYIPSLDSVSSYSFQNYIYETTQALVRISDYNNPEINDESDNVFSVILPPVYVYSPYYGNFYYFGSEVYISWYSDQIQSFTLEFSPDNGTSWSNIVTGITAFEYYWTAPSTATEQALIRISDASDPSAYGLSQTFSIRDLPSLTIVAPNGGETWHYGEIAEISWTGSNLPPYMYAEFSADGGSSWSGLGYAYSQPDGGSLQVYVPYFSTTDARVRLVDYYNYTMLDQSDASFTVIVPPVIVYYPSGGEMYYNGQTMYFSWLASNEVTSLNFELSTNGGQSWSMFAENIDAASGYYYWTVSGTPSETCQVRISDAANPSSFGTSGVFTILETPVITLTAPAGGEILNTNEVYTISWQYDNPSASYVYLEFSSDNGQTWNYISYAYLDGPEGTFQWTTPVLTSSECRIRVMDYYLPFVADTSDVFTVIPYPATPICMVTVDSVTNHNIIVWDKPVSALIDKFVVYKETDQADVYEALAIVNYSDEAIVTDTSSNPTIKSYRYKLGFQDAEGHQFPAGDFHQTIHLTINQGVGNSWNLIWNGYVGFEVSSYDLYRKVGNGNYELISSISSSFNSYTDLTAPAGDVFYVIGVDNPNGCNPVSRSGDYTRTWSNVATNSVLGLSEGGDALPVAIFPNPADVNLFVAVGETLSGRVIFKLSDLLGHTVHSQVVEDVKNQGLISINTINLQEGIYLLKISTDKGSVTRKVMVKH